MVIKPIYYKKDIIAELKKEIVICSFEGKCDCWNKGNPSFEDCVNCSAIIYINKKGITIK